MGVFGGPNVSEDGLVLALDAANSKSYGNKNFVISKIYASYGASLRSSNYTVQYSDDNSNWTTAFTGVASNNTSCGIQQNTGSGSGYYGLHRYWRYVEGSPIQGHHPRVSRIILTDINGIDYNLVVYTSDNCSDTGTYQVGTVSLDFGGTIWTDLSGGGNTGTLVNGVGYSASNGGALVFDGDDAKVESSQNFSFGNTQQRTYDIWYKSILGTDQMLIALTANLNDYKWQTIAITSNGTLNYMFGDNSFYNERGQLDANSSAFGYYIPGLTASTGGWQNICMTVNINETHPNRIKIYVGGINYSDKINYFNNSGNAIYDGSMNLQFGAANFGQGANLYAPLNGKISNVKLYNRALTAAEVSQNYNALRGRFTPEYETLTYTASGNLTVTGNGTNSVTIFKTSGGDGWDNQAYNLESFNAPCTIEFNKQAASGDNGVSYAMIGWNADPTANASYSSIDHASYPYRTDQYQVYHNGSQVHASGTWSTANKFYIVYGTDGFIRHYNGSTLLYSVNYGTGNTVYVDSSFYSVNATFGGFSNIKVIRLAWNGTDYV